MKKNVLVIPCGSEIGLEIYRSISHSTHFEVYGGSSVEDHGTFVYKNYIGGLPYVSEDDFVDAVNRITDELKIDIIIPAHDDVVLKLSQAEAKGTLKAKVMTSPLETCEITRSKLKTYERMGTIIAVPETYHSASDIADEDFPVFLKPEVGQGSKGTHLIKTQVDAEYLSGGANQIITEYLPGPEYTVDCFTNKNGELLFCQGRKRNRILNGISVNTTFVENGKFKQLADKINQELTFRGAWFFQLKERKSGELVLMEIAPRIAGTMALVRAKGVNLPLLSLFDAFDYDVDVFENSYGIIIDRALGNRYKHDFKYSHVYLDFDDLVIFEGKINTMVMAFVFQCMNSGVKVHLLTRHKQNLEESLKKYKLTNIFDDYVWIKEGEPKHQYINKTDAIFIDDSFAERKAVADKLGIPVFDAHMIECLMEGEL